MEERSVKILEVSSKLFYVEDLVRKGNRENEKIIFEALHEIETLIGSILADPGFDTSHPQQEHVRLMKQKVQELKVQCWNGDVQYLSVIQSACGILGSTKYDMREAFQTELNCKLQKAVCQTMQSISKSIELLKIDEPIKQHAENQDRQIDQ